MARRQHIEIRLNAYRDRAMRRVPSCLEHPYVTSQSGCSQPSPRSCYEHELKRGKPSLRRVCERQRLLLLSWKSSWRVAQTSKRNPASTPKTWREICSVGRKTSCVVSGSSVKSLHSKIRFRARDDISCTECSRPIVQEHTYCRQANNRQNIDQAAVQPPSIATTEPLTNAASPDARYSAR
jgi:hypothetical protein